MIMYNMLIKIIHIFIFSSFLRIRFKIIAFSYILYKI